MKVFKTLNSPAKNKSRITKIEGFLVSSKREESTKCGHVVGTVTVLSLGIDDVTSLDAGAGAKTFRLAVAHPLVEGSVCR